VVGTIVHLAPILTGLPARPVSWISGGLARRERHGEVLKFAAKSDHDARMTVRYIGFEHWL